MFQPLVVRPHNEWCVRVVMLMEGRVTVALLRGQLTLRPISQFKDSATNKLELLHCMHSYSQILLCTVKYST